MIHTFSFQRLRDFFFFFSGEGKKDAFNCTVATFQTTLQWLVSCDKNLAKLLLSLKIICPP